LSQRTTQAPYTTRLSFHVKEIIQMQPQSYFDCQPAMSTSPRSQSLPPRPSRSQYLPSKTSGSEYLLTFKTLQVLGLCLELEDLHHAQDACRCLCVVNFLNLLLYISCLCFRLSRNLKLKSSIQHFKLKS
jgi:hypothetical protein